jgi:hypothetical protein
MFGSRDGQIKFKVEDLLVQSNYTESRVSQHCLLKSSPPLCPVVLTIFLNVLYLHLPPFFTNIKNIPPSLISQIPYRVL